MCHFRAQTDQVNHLSVPASCRGELERDRQEGTRGCCVGMGDSRQRRAGPPFQGEEEGCRVLCGDPGLGRVQCSTLWRAAALRAGRNIRCSHQGDCQIRAKTDMSQQGSSGPRPGPASGPAMALRGAIQDEVCGRAGGPGSFGALHLPPRSISGAIRARKKPPCAPPTCCGSPSLDGVGGSVPGHESNAARPGVFIETAMRWVSRVSHGASSLIESSQRWRSKRCSLAANWSTSRWGASSPVTISLGGLGRKPVAEGGAPSSSGPPRQWFRMSWSGGILVRAAKRCAGSGSPRVPGRDDRAKTWLLPRRSGVSPWLVGPALRDSAETART